MLLYVCQASKTSNTQRKAEAWSEILYKINNFCHFLVKSEA